MMYCSDCKYSSRRRVCMNWNPNESLSDSREHTCIPFALKHDLVYEHSYLRTTSTTILTVKMHIWYGNFLLTHTNLHTSFLPKDVHYNGEGKKNIEAKRKTRKTNKVERNASKFLKTVDIEHGMLVSMMIHSSSEVRLQTESPWLF